MSEECTCYRKFMDAEDYRDHLPCPGHPIEQLTVAKICDWLRNGGDYLVEGQFIADAIERGDWKR